MENSPDAFETGYFLTIASQKNVPRTRTEPLSAHPFILSHPLLA